MKFARCCCSKQLVMQMYLFEISFANVKWSRNNELFGNIVRIVSSLFECHELRFVAECEETVIALSTGPWKWHREFPKRCNRGRLQLSKTREVISWCRLKIWYQEFASYSESENYWSLNANLLNSQEQRNIFWQTTCTSASAIS